MPTLTQYTIAKKQCESFKALGLRADFDIQQGENFGEPKIVIDAFYKSWRFCDPDWDKVIRQLAELYKHVKKDRKTKESITGTLQKTVSGITRKT